jgi:hypothetical protein
LLTARQFREQVGPRAHTAGLDGDLATNHATSRGFKVRDRAFGTGGCLPYRPRSAPCGSPDIIRQSHRVVNEHHPIIQGDRKIVRCFNG